MRKRAGHWLANCALGVLAAASLAGFAPQESFEDRSFDLYQGFYGRRAYTDPAAAANFSSRMATGFSFSAPVDSGLVGFIRGQNAGLMLDLPGATHVANQPATYIETQREALAEIGPTGGAKPIWVLMPEWDQGGGRWVPRGRPRYRNLTRQQAYNRFRNYYVTAAQPLGQYLQEPPATRDVTLAAVTDHSPNAFYAYEWGVDFAFLERGIDELGDLSTGIAFQRGAAAQYDRKWGIDLSTWRTSNGRSTQFDDQGVLTGGWSPSYIRRHLYGAYLSGAHSVLIEPTIYYDASGRLNPFGEVVREFADFGLNRHPDIGRPAVSTALLLDHHSGFDTKHGLYNQANAVWYQDIPYGEGDFMIDNFLKAAYPNHWLQGLTPGAPFADANGKPDHAGFQEFLSRGEDPRPYEPMASTRWGNNLDVITTQAGLETMRRYKVIAVLGAVPLETPLRDALRTWVAEGGTLVLNASQVSAEDESLLGVRLGTAVRTGRDSRWLPDGAEFTEQPYRYSVAAPTSASVIATTSSGDPLVTVNALGSGQVVLSTPAFLQTAARNSLLAIGTKLFDVLQEAAAPARVIGPPVEYIVNQAPGRLIVSIVNNSGQPWSGNILADASGHVTGVLEYTLDEAAEYSVDQSEVRIAARVPAYDLRVYAMQYDEPSRGTRPGLLHGIAGRTKR